MNRSARSIRVLLVLAIVGLSAAPAHAKKADHDGYVQTNLVSDGRSRNIHRSQPEKSLGYFLPWRRHAEPVLDLGQ